MVVRGRVVSRLKMVGGFVLFFFFRGGIKIYFYIDIGFVVWFVLFKEMLENVI